MREKFIEEMQDMKDPHVLIRNLTKDSLLLNDKREEEIAHV